MTHDDMLQLMKVAYRLGGEVWVSPDNDVRVATEYVGRLSDAHVDEWKGFQHQCWRVRLHEDLGFVP